MQAFTIIEQQLQELSRELQNKDKLIGRYMDQQALDAGFKKAQDLKYFRLKNQLRKISQIVIELKRRAAIAKLTILKQDKQLERLIMDRTAKENLDPHLGEAAVDALLSSIHSDTSIKLESQNLVMETLQRENVEMFARIGQERQDAQVRISYLEFLLQKHGIPFDEADTSNSGSISSNIAGGEELRPFLGAHAAASDPVESINQLAPNDDLVMEGRKRQKILIESAKATSSSLTSDTNIFPLAAITEEDIANEVGEGGRGVAVAAEAERLDTRLASSVPMTATQSLEEQFYGGEGLDEFLSSEEEATEDEEVDLNDADMHTKEWGAAMDQDHQDSPTDSKKNHEQSPLSQPIIPSSYLNQDCFEEADRTLINSAGKAITTTTLRDQPVLKKLKVYSKASNFQFDDNQDAGRAGMFKTPGAAVPTASHPGRFPLPEKSFKTAAGVYVQRKVAPVSASATPIESIAAKPKDPKTTSSSSFSYASSVLPTKSSSNGPPRMTEPLQRPASATAFKFNQVERDKATRNLMHGTDCACCKDYYAATADLKRGVGRSGGGSGIKESRHKVWTERPKTPEGYWDVDFPSTQEVQDHQKRVQGME